MAGMLPSKVLENGERRYPEDEIPCLRALKQRGIRSDAALLRTSQAAALIKVNPETLRVWAKAGMLAYFELPNGERRYLAADVIDAGSAWHQR